MNWYRPRTVLCCLAVTLAPALVYAGTATDTAVAEGNQRIGLSIWNAPAIALDDGMATGAMLEGRHHFAWGAVQPEGAGPLFLGLQGGAAFSELANRYWQLSHLQGVMAVGLGLSYRHGAGSLSLQVGGGLQAVYETRTRHQSERLALAEISGVEGSGWTLGPFGFSELGIALQLFPSLFATISGGVNATRQTVAGEPSLVWGWHQKLGVAYAF